MLLHWHCLNKLLQHKNNVEVLVIPTIYSNLYNKCSNSAVSNNYPHLKNLKLAQESNKICIKVDISIGLDYYCNFMIGTFTQGSMYVKY